MINKPNTIKTSIIFVSLAIIVTFALSKNSLAASSFFNSYEKMYMTTSANNFYEKTTPFNYNEKPWLYIQLTNPEVTQAVKTDSSWMRTTMTTLDPSQIYTNTYSDDKNNLWISFSDEYWNSIKKPGAWTIKSTSSIENNNSISAFSYANMAGTTNFKINTADESSAWLLFIIGLTIVLFRNFNKIKNLLILATNR